jgi:glycosyltransferase involved in cell wall biosynthesis
VDQGLKALQYGASGMATAASWTETNAEILGEGDGTLLCRTRDEWFAALTRLLDDDDFRVQMGVRARERVEADYSLHIMAPRLYRAIVDGDEAAGDALAS